MIRKITYLIRFPFGALFNKDPKYLFLKNIYKEIKKSSDNSVIGNIYTRISGDGFTRYPAIIIKRDFFEKTNYNRNETLMLDFYLIGDVEIYYAFITEYFNTFEYLNNSYFQKSIITNELIDERGSINNLIIFDTPIKSIDDIIANIKYYNNTYNAMFSIPEIEEVNLINIRDCNEYRFDKNIIRINGYKGIVKVINYPKVLLEIGIGGYSVLGGGRAHEN